MRPVTLDDIVKLRGQINEQSAEINRRFKNRLEAAMSDTTDNTPIAAPSSTPAHRVQPYKRDELAERLGDGSLDLPRLGATVEKQAETLAHVAAWINSQIEASQPKAKKG